MLYQQIARNKRKTAFLLVIFVIILSLVGGGLGYLINGEPFSGIAIALIGSLIYLFIILQNPGNLVMSMNHGREIHEEDDPELWHIVEDMALAGQVPMPRVFIIDDPSPNAFAMFNEKLLTFPSNLVAKMHGFKKLDYLQTPTEEKAVPQVKF